MSFAENPLRFLELTLQAEQARGSHPGAFWFAPGRLCVVDPHAARQVLGNREADYREHSDFFFSRLGAPGPRAAQVRIGRDARELILRHMSTKAPDLPALVARRLAPTSQWPHAGNLLFREYFGPLLMRPDTASKVHRTVERIVTLAVLAGARERRSTMARFLLRTELHLRLGAEVANRQRRRATAPADLLDVIVAAGLDAPVEQLVEVYLSFLFALVGSLGFALGWSVYLLGTQTPVDSQPAPSGVVREALRLWPVAWLFGRRPSRPHQIAGVSIDPSDEVSVCTWLTHRDEGFWHRPDEFLPERWRTPAPNPAYLPFGFGTHACPGAGLSTRLLEDLVHEVTSAWQTTVTVRGTGDPHVGPALAPPTFTAVLDPRS